MGIHKNKYTGPLLSKCHLVLEVDLMLSYLYRRKGNWALKANSKPTQHSQPHSRVQYRSFLIEPSALDLKCSSSPHPESLNKQTAKLLNHTPKPKNSNPKTPNPETPWVEQLLRESPKAKTPNGAGANGRGSASKGFGASPKAQNSPKALYSMVFGPKSL